MKDGNSAKNREDNGQYMIVFDVAAATIIAVVVVISFDADCHCSTDKRNVIR